MVPWNLFIATLSLAFCYKANFYNNKDQTSYHSSLSKSTNSSGSTKYDFIVVGSGPTGSMVAITLANKGFKVLLMEAGPDYMSEKVKTPAFYLKASEEKKISWDFHVKHYPEVTNLRQKVLYPRVSALGGCTLHNALVHVYPRKSDFDLMVSLTGDSSWDEKNMRTYMDEMTGSTKSIQSLMPMRLASQTILLGGVSNLVTNAMTMLSSNKGWLPIIVYNTHKLLQLDFKVLDIITNVLLGPSNIDILSSFDINDYSGKVLSNSKEGNFFAPMNVDSNTLERKGIYEHLKATSKKNPNLVIATNVFVTKIILDETNTKALGVSYMKGKNLYKASPLHDDSTWDKTELKNVYAKKEVIISAGVFNTPQLMMLSGIGDEQHLEQTGITPKINLPGVGKNMMDRYEVALNFKFNSNFTLLDGCFLKDTDACFTNYKKSGLGVYTFNAILAGNLAKSEPNVQEPDLFTLHAPIYFSGYKKGMSDAVVNNKDVYSLLLLKANTTNNAGTVLLRSKDPRDTPDINFNYFYKGGSGDMKAIIKGIRNSRKIANNFFSDLKEITPGPEYKSNEELANFIQNTSWGHHACCTMKIGLDDEEMSVLDSKFRVRGTKNLRVADMSIFNKIPGYFPVLYLYMVGAKIGDTIANDYSN